MRKLLVVLDDELDTYLSGVTNQNETIRQALRLHKSSIETGTVAGMQQAFIETRKRVVELQQRFVEQYELLERLTKIVEELIQR